MGNSDDWPKSELKRLFWEHPDSITQDEIGRRIAASDVVCGVWVNARNELDYIELSGEKALAAHTRAGRVGPLILAVVPCTSEEQAIRIKGMVSHIAKP